MNWINFLIGWSFGNIVGSFIFDMPIFAVIGFSLMIGGLVVAIEHDKSASLKEGAKQ